MYLIEYSTGIADQIVGGCLKISTIGISKMYILGYYIIVIRIHFLTTTL